MVEENETVGPQAAGETSSSVIPQSEDQIPKTKVANSEAPVEENRKTGHNRKPRSKPKSGRKRKRKPAQDQVKALFAACGRCSFFLAGIQLVCGEAALNTAVEQRGTRWLTFPWNWELVDLVQKSYGSRVDIDCYHFEGCCPECRRNFVYQAADKAGEAATIRVELKPRTR